MSLGREQLPVARDAVSPAGHPDRARDGEDLGDDRDVSSTSDDLPSAKGDDQSPLDRLLELGVFAPIGLVLELPRLLPDLVESGRKQIVFSQSLGRAAIRTIARGAQRDTKPSPSGREGASTGPVDGYDSMTAREVVALLRRADPPTVAWVSRREREGKQRVTVLRAVAAQEARP